MWENFDSTEHLLNVGAHTWEELAPYAGQFVAWSFDGKTILAHAPEEEDLYKEIARLGLTEYVVGYIWPPDARCWGSAELSLFSSEGEAHGWAAE
jgi:hypothetical protein